MCLCTHTRTLKNVEFSHSERFRVKKIRDTVSAAPFGYFQAWHIIHLNGKVIFASAPGDIVKWSGMWAVRQERESRAEGGAVRRTSVWNCSWGNGIRIWAEDKGRSPGGGFRDESRQQLAWRTGRFWVSLSHTFWLLLVSVHHRPPQGSHLLGL